jgi:cytochrome c oxidase cbb3-type subunit 3
MTLEKNQRHRQSGEVTPHSMLILVWPVAAILAMACLGGTFLNRALIPSAKAQASQPQPQTNISSVPGNGAEIFASRCAECHGLDGRGSERAPNIASRPTVQQLSNDELVRIIQQGILGTGMPAFRSLQMPEVQAVVAYLRTLQGTESALNLPGNPERGKALFFGGGRCSTCHMVDGAGGFIASDLSKFSGNHSVEQIRNAITSPAVDRQSRTAVATTHSGVKYSGRIRNEDNFSIQLQALDGAFHLLLKSDLTRLDYASQSLMPSDYRSVLKPDELNDLIGYLMTLGKSNRTEPDEGFED